MNQSSFTSRAGEKLEYALTEFKIDVKDKVCADFGSSVGGFVDCLLQYGASKVYAVETGYGELAWKLRQNPKVVVMERTNAMHVALPEKADIITNDTSWTRQEKIFPNILANLKPYGRIITLIKPHYESGKSHIEEKEAEEIAKQTADQLTQEYSLELKGLIRSPILGKKGGNNEYLAYFKITN